VQDAVATYMHLSNIVKALAVLCLRPYHYHMSAYARDASQNGATSQQVLMCSKDTELTERTSSREDTMQHIL